MGLLSDWRDHAYGLDDRTEEGKNFWLTYFNKEKAVYQQLLAHKEYVEKGTVKELAEKYDMTIELMVGFLDGINESLREENDLENLTEDTVVKLDFEPESLYMNMVDCNAEWLYTLPEWNDILDEERRKELFKEAKSRKTIVKPKKIGRNDPCPCGSGKKYKKCCGANV